MSFKLPLAGTARAWAHTPLTQDHPSVRGWTDILATALAEQVICGAGTPGIVAASVELAPVPDALRPFVYAKLKQTVEALGYIHINNPETHTFTIVWRPSELGRPAPEAGEIVEG